MLLFIPLMGNLYPHRVSFLLSMRYYAGNWAYGIWLFHKESECHLKLERHIKKASRWVPAQIRMFYDEETVVGVLSKVPAFRMMHQHGRVLHDVIPRAVDAIEAYEYVDGEMVAGLVLGWNFGDGPLHDEQMLRYVQAQCGFEPGELRCIFVESQPLGKDTMDWRIVDAATGEVERGTARVSALVQMQPYPESASASVSSRRGP